MVVKRATAADIQAMETRLDNDLDYRDHSRRLAYRLRELRLERGLSQEGVAHRAGLALYTELLDLDGSPRPARSGS